jgi:hypothetical protein
VAHSAKMRPRTFPFCSQSREGNHDWSSLSTYPLGVKDVKRETNKQTNGKHAFSLTSSVEDCRDLAESPIKIWGDILTP